MSEVNTTKRLHTIDALRGFALIGIILVHFSEQYLGVSPTVSMQEVMNRDTIDNALNALVTVLLRGKFFALFAILFGLSFYIQMTSGLEKSNQFYWRFLWRLVILFVIGYLHSLIYRGDILTIYASLGMMLVLFYRMNTRTILVISLFILVGFPKLLTYFVINPVFGEGLFLSNRELDDLRYLSAITSGGIVDVAKENIVVGQLAKLEYQIIDTSRIFLTLGYFLVGIMLGRIALFKRFSELSGVLMKFFVLTVVLFTATMIAVKSFQVDFLTTANLNFDFFIVGWLKEVADTMLTGSIICLFLLAHRFRLVVQVMYPLQAFGRMALTNYVTQSLLGCFVFYHWGLNLAGNVSTSVALAIGVFVVALQITISVFWFKWYRFGLLEWMWRCLTKLKWQPLVH